MMKTNNYRSLYYTGVLLFLVFVCCQTFVIAAYTTSTPNIQKTESSPTPDAKKESIDSLRKKLSDKINRDKEIRLIYLGFLQKIESNQLTLNSLEGKALNFTYDPSITESVIAGKSKSASGSATFKTKDFLILTSDGTSANLALKIVKPKLAEYIFGELVTIDEEKKKLTIVSHETREEKEITITKNQSIYLPEPKSLTTKKSALSKLKTGDLIQVVYYPVDQNSDVIVPLKLTVIPKEMVTDK